MSESPSILTKPVPNLRIKEGAPPIVRPPREEMERYPKEAKEDIDKNFHAKDLLLGSKNYGLDSLKGKHFFLAGATGPGLGGALATILLDLLKDSGTITIVARDIKKTLGYYMGLELQSKAENLGYGDRFHLLNNGLASEGKKFAKITDALKEANADDLIYINTVASASSGLLPDTPPIYVKDIDSDGLFQWKMTPLDERSIAMTQEIMGTQAVEFPDILEREGLSVSTRVFADWRGSLDKISRDPKNKEYGRQGAYSSSLYLPKDIIQNYVSKSIGSDKIIFDGFFPIMRTRALSYIPGGLAMSNVYANLMKKAGVKLIDIPELALNLLEYLAFALKGTGYNPFPRFDGHEAALEQWFYEVVYRLNEDENSPYHYKNWIEK